jgi:MFS family permease
VSYPAPTPEGGEGFRGSVRRTNPKEKNRAGFFPGAVYLTSAWYMPAEIAARISYFPCAAALSGAFSGLLAAGIANMDGVGGYRGWRWIFVRNQLTPLDTRHTPHTLRN